MSLEEYWEIWNIHLGMLFTKQEYYKNCFTRRFAKSRIGDAQNSANPVNFSNNQTCQELQGTGFQRSFQRPLLCYLFFKRDFGDLDHSVVHLN